MTNEEKRICSCDSVGSVGCASPYCEYGEEKPKFPPEQILEIDEEGVVREVDEEKQ